MCIRDSPFTACLTHPPNTCLIREQAIYLLGKITLILRSRQQPGLPIHYHFLESPEIARNHSRPASHSFTQCHTEGLIYKRRRYQQSTPPVQRGQFILLDPAKPPYPIFNAKTRRQRPQLPLVWSLSCYP